MQHKRQPTRPVRLYGRQQSSGAHEIGDPLTRSVVAFEWVDLAADVHGRQELGLPGAGLFHGAGLSEAPLCRGERVASAVGEGAMAVALVHRYLAGTA